MQFPRNITIAVIAIAIMATYGHPADKSSKRGRTLKKPLAIWVATVGPTQAELDDARKRIESDERFRSLLGKARYRAMAHDVLKKSDGSELLRITYYDYTNDRTFTAETDLTTGPVAIIEDPHARARNDHIIGVNVEEIDEAKRLVQARSELEGRKILATASVMPPVSVVNGERLVNIGVLTTGERRIVGVNFRNRSIVVYESGVAAPAAPEDHCGIANALQATTSNGTAGQLLLTVETGQPTPLWQMTVVRPSASTGSLFERSGIEIRDVKYKGKSVLKRGHVPLLNVSYGPNSSGCGDGAERSYRDWQWQEGMFNAPSTGAIDHAPGFRELANGQIATTSMESGSDTGNFRGVAIYRQDVGNGQEIVLVSEMEAGWYRYIMEWRFAANGIIRPRFGFGSVANNCTCISHHHHAYWRLDFDIVNPVNKAFRTERGRKFLVPVNTETQIPRSLGTNRGIVIQNSTGNEAYSLTPGVNDGFADEFGVGDFWLLRFAGTANDPGELDDPGAGLGETTRAANISAWLNSEPVVDNDIVVWYTGHFRHDSSNENELIKRGRNAEVLGTSHVVGPDLRPIRW